MSVDLVSAEAEQTVIGHLLNHPESWKIVSGKISTSDFAFGLHKAVWSAIGELLSAGAPVNPMTVTHRIGKQHWQTVQEIARSAIGSTKIERFAEVLKDRSTRRRLASINPHAIASESGSAAEAVGKVQAEINAITMESVQTGPRMIGEILGDWRQELSDRRNHGGGVRGLRTGLSAIDARWSGLCAGQMIVIAGRPGNGKTTLAMNIANTVALAGKSVLVFSFEMHDIELTDKVVSSHGVPLSGIKSGDLNQDGWDRTIGAIAAIRDIRLAIDSGTSRTIDHIHLASRAHQMRHGLDLVIVDYLQQVGGEGKDRRLQVESVSRGLKLMALEMKIPVIALSQMSRQVENRADKRPVMSDLRESGAIEQDADIVSFVHRPELTNPEDSDWKGLAEIITAKSRHTEPGTDIVQADLSRSRFVDYDGARPTARPAKRASGGGDL